MRTLVYRFDSLIDFEQTLLDGDQELELPPGEGVAEGEWVLAMFEVGKRKRATAAAARGMDCGNGEMILVFERRDWERLQAFASTATSERLSVSMPVAAMVDIPITVDAESQMPPPISKPPLSSGAMPTSPPVGYDQDRSSRPSMPAARSSGRFHAATNARVLVIDDDPDIREVVGAMLESVGLVVNAVDSAEAALEMVASQPFDLLVLDWNLPGMTGIDLCRHFRREPRFATLPVLFLTAHASSKDVVEAFASGADDYVVKPFRAPELGARIFGLLRRARVKQASL